MTEMVLNTFFRSSAAWRVRIALHLKGLEYRSVYRNFRENAQRAPDHLALNPQGLVPTLVVEGTALSQSLAIIEYLDEIHPAPRLLPDDPVGRAQVRAMAAIVASDIHPIGNLRVLQYLRTRFGQDEEAVADWYRHLASGDGLPRVDRYEAPGLHALNFVVHDALAGGINASTRLDPAAKGMAQMLLRFPVLVPPDLAATIGGHDLVNGDR